MRFCSKILFISLLAGIWSCNSFSKKDGDASENISLKNGSISSLIFGSCDTVRNQGVSVSVTMWMPAEGDTAASNIYDQLNGKVIDRINSFADSTSIAGNPEARISAKEAYKVFANNYTIFKKDFPDAPGCWEVEIKGDTVMVTPKLMVYRLSHYSFTGGAHPNNFTSLHIFDGANGDEKQAGSFIADSVKLLQKVEQTFRKIEKLTPDANLEEKGYFLVNHHFFLPANYTFTKAGVLFYYNPYEIAAYVRGPIEFTIPYADLKDIVKLEKIF